MTSLEISSARVLFYGKFFPLARGVRTDVMCLPAETSWSWDGKTG